MVQTTPKRNKATPSTFSYDIINKISLNVKKFFFQLLSMNCKENIPFIETLALRERERDDRKNTKSCTIIHEYYITEKVRVKAILSPSDA